MKKVIILAVLFLMGQTSWAQIRDFQTTRLNSTAGAGVASILSTEAALLNPAASAFFEGSSFSYQSYTTELKKVSPERDTLNDPFQKNNRAQGLFMADHSGPVKGGAAYINQNENGYDRDRMALHGAVPMSASSSLGVSYNYIQDRLPAKHKDRHQTHHQLSMGTVHILDEKTIIGLVLLDPTKTVQGNERLIGGFQYNVAERFMLIGDIGTQYTKNVKKKYLWRVAAQINIFSDFFFRAGKFYDNVSNFEGTGWGAGWIGPRFGVEFAQKFSEHIGDRNYLYKGESLVDTSLSAIIKF
ncbi:MAG TPA: hypothetical protein VNJ01_14405 [Bacteriovoracaceae bacterium]|nr:hypothetical protein [Bacteriovoracaceae bacterium]